MLELSCVYNKFLKWKIVMANVKQSFFFDRVRSSANNKREIVVQGYAVDGFLDTMRPRAAIFVGSKAVKAL